MADPFILSHIRRLPLFAQLTPEQLEAAAGLFQQVRCRAGDALYQQGENSHALYLFISGAADILQVGPDRMQRRNAQVTAGQYVGEASLFSGDVRDVSVVATQDSILLMLAKPRLDELLTARPDIRRALNVRKDLMPHVQVQQQRNVSSDESVLLTTRRHPWMFANKALRAVILFTALLALAILGRNLPASLRLVPLSLCGLGIVVPLLLTTIWFFDWENDFFTITNQRVIHEERHLLTGREEREQVLLTSIQNVNIQRNGYIAELVNFGDLVITTAGQPRPMVLDHLPNPSAVQQAIFTQLQRTPQPQAVGVVPAPGGYAGPTVSMSPLPPMPSANTSQASSRGGLFPRSRTVDGSRIIYRKHWFVLIGHISKPLFFFALLFLLIGIRLFVHNAVTQAVSAGAATLIVFVWLAINTFWLVWEYLSWYEDVYIVDDQMITDIVRTPFGLRESRMQAALQQVQNVTSTIPNLWGSVFNFGSVTIQTAAENAQMVFKGVANPTSIAEEVLRRVRQYQEWRAAGAQASQQRAFADMMAAYNAGNRPESGTNPQNWPPR